LIVNFQSVDDIFNEATAIWPTQLPNFRFSNKGTINILVENSVMEITLI